MADRPIIDPVSIRTCTASRFRWCRLGSRRSRRWTTARSKPPPLFRVRPPEGAPNVVIVLMDQSCYADPEMFGGRIRTPTLERLARTG